MAATERVQLVRAKFGMARRAYRLSYSADAPGGILSSEEAAAGLLVRGWVAPHHRLAEQVIVRVDGQAVTQAPVVWPPEAAQGSWEAELSWDCLPEGPRELGALLLRSDGLWNQLPSVAYESPGGTPVAAVDDPPRGSEFAAGGITASGWFRAGAGYDSLELSLGGRSLGRARLMARYRPDLAAMFSDSDAPLAGWEFAGEIPEGGAGRQVLIIDAVAEHGRRNIAKIEVKVSEPRPAPVVDPARVAVLRRRAALAAASHEPDAEGVNLLVATHHLGLGGGQLYLQLLLERLATDHGVRATVLAGDDGPLRDELEELGMPVHVVGPPPAESARYEEWLHQLIGLITASGVNAALVNTAGCFWGVDLAERLGVPAVWAIHESFHPDYFLNICLPQVPDAGVRETFNQALRYAAAVVFEADATKELYLDHITPGNALRIDYGVDLAAIAEYRETHDREEVRAELGFEPTDIVLLCLGTFEPRKAQGLLAAAFAQACVDHPNAVLALVGERESWYSTGVRAVLDRLPAGTRVRTVPIIAEIAPWYLAADAFVLASDIESLPRSMLEAMAYRTPVIGTAVFGVPEIVKDGVTGFLFEPGSIRAASEAMGRFLSFPPAQRDDLGRAAEELVWQSRSAQGYSQEYLALFQRLIGSRP
ncbi:MAG: glycosyltransferase family 4 protein [Candidatus Nanopelagicales bacterium]